MSPPAMLLRTRDAKAKRREHTRAPRSAQRTASIHTQPELPFGAADPRREALERRLRIALGTGLEITVTDNRRTMVSIRRSRGVAFVRLHHMFTQAPGEIVDALGRYLVRGDRHASKLIDGFIAANQRKIRVERPAPSELRPRGIVHDLAEIQQSLSRRYFASAVWLDITWGRPAPSHLERRSRRTIRMGTYHIEEQLIRIHPALDQVFVPRYFVEWVVYHEMLHHVVPMPEVNGRRVYHSHEFRRRERLYEEYERARTWEQSNLRKLIAARRVAATS